MTEPRPWNGSDQRLFELQEKVNTYLSFALDGEMLEQLPQLAGKKLRLQLDCVDQPDPKTEYFLGLIQQQIGFQDIKFTVSLVPDLVCAPSEAQCRGNGGCGCHSREDNAKTGSPRKDRSDCCGGGHCGCA